MAQPKLGANPASNLSLESGRGTDTCSGLQPGRWLWIKYSSEVTTLHIKYLDDGLLQNPKQLTLANISNMANISNINRIILWISWFFVNPFPGLLHFTLETYLIMWSIKQGSIHNYFWVFGMTRPRIEPRSLRPLANTLPIRYQLVVLASIWALFRFMKKKKFLNDFLFIYI